MSMEKVPQEYSEGVAALLKLTRMMEASISEAMPNATFKRTAGWSWRDFNVDGYFYGLRPARPLLVVFESNMGNSPTHKRNLDLVDVGFFSKSKDEQFECLVAFLRQRAKMMRHLHRQMV
jgi:hypothetical protein